MYWPLGIEILLAAGVQDNGRFLGYSRDWIRGQITPLEYAIKDRQDEAILLLLDTDFVMKLKHDNVLAVVMQYHYQPSSRIVTATIEAMVRRSNHLRRLAIAHLSPHELDRLRISYEDEPIQILDAYAADTAETLKHVGVKIPEALEPGWVGSTVYHILVDELYSYAWSKELWTEFGDRLWYSGFHDTHVYDKDGFTALHRACVFFQLDMVNWLMSHGGDPTTVVRGHSLNAFHILSHGLKYKIEKHWLSIMESMVGLSGDPLTSIAGVCRASCRDDCRCACSPEGCTPTTILLRTMTLTWKDKKDLFLSWCRCVELSPDAVESCCSEFARVETFERLGISHVCCEIDLYEGVADMPQDIMEEIQDEESEMIDQLESWMILYEEERAKFEGSAIQFLDKWSDMLKDKLYVPAQFEEYGRNKAWMPDHFARPWYEVMEEDQDCISDYHTKPSHVEHGHEEMDEDQTCMSDS